MIKTIIQVKRRNKKNPELIIYMEQMDAKIVSKMHLLYPTKNKDYIENIFDNFKGNLHTFWTVIDLVKELEMELGSDFSVVYAPFYSRTKNLTHELNGILRELGDNYERKKVK